MRATLERPIAEPRTRRPSTGRSSGCSADLASELKESRSAVWQQAANRLPTEQALFDALCTGELI